jgi:hypothetical protein
MAGSTVWITYDDVDLGETYIEGSVLFAETTFECQMAAIPGTFRLVVSDPEHTHSFVTGREIKMYVDGVRLYGGYVTQVSKEYAFEADDTSVPANTKSRRWVLTGVDYNILFDKRILRNPADTTKQIDTVGTGGIYDGAVLRSYLHSWFDGLSDVYLDTTTVLDTHRFKTGYTPPTPGAKLREIMDDLASYGSVYYIDADKTLNFVPVQDTLSYWGFSDHPSLVDSPPTIGFRDGEMTEDASAVVNDALVWGGSEWAKAGTVVFAERTNSASITAHGLWQYAEVHVGEKWYKIQDDVDARARVIVDGNEMGTWAEGSKGLVLPEKQFTGTWWAHDVVDSGFGHIRPPNVVPIDMQVFGFTMNVPLRQMQVTFPGLDKDGNAYVQFQGTFGVLMTDPYWLWSYLRKLQGQTVTVIAPPPADNTTPDPPPGSVYNGYSPSPAPDGNVTVFYLGAPGSPLPYVGGTAQVYLNGIAQQLGVVWTESNPSTGEITFVTAPLTGDVILVVATLVGGVAPTPGTYEGFGTYTTGGEGY